MFEQLLCYFCYRCNTSFVQLSSFCCRCNTMFEQLPCCFCYRCNITFEQLPCCFCYRCSITFEQMSSTLGIHPTVAEEVVRLTITKRSGLDPIVTGC